MDEDIIKKKLQTLFKSKKFAVLSTSDHGQPYASLVAFVEGPDLDWILFATERSTRKYKNLSHNRRIALMIENSTNSEKDVDNAMAVTVTGGAEIVSDMDKKALSRIYMAKHPYLEGFITSSTCALIKIKVEQYVLVENFKETSVLDII